MLNNKISSPFRKKVFAAKTYYLNSFRASTSERDSLITDFGQDEFRKETDSTDVRLFTELLNNRHSVLVKLSNDAANPYHSLGKKYKCLILINQ
jgi:hypothetical protein